MGEKAPSNNRSEPKKLPVFENGFDGHSKIQTTTNAAEEIDIKKEEQINLLRDKAESKTSETGSETNDEVVIKLNFILVAAAIGIGLIFFIIIIIILLLLITMSGSGMLTSDKATQSISLKASGLLPAHIKITSQIADLITPSIEDKQLTQKIKFTFEPQSSTICLGDSTILSCQMSQSVQCNWKRNNQLVAISDRYSFVSSEYGTDCSIIITDVNEMDLGKWTCWFKNDELNEETADALIMQQDSSKCKQQKKVKIGSELSIECEFEEPTECAWLRNGVQVSIRGRYRFTKGDGTNSKQCALTISSFSNYDVGNWTCVSPANSNRLDAINRDPITLAAI